MSLFDKLKERAGDFMDEVMLSDQLHVQLERAERAILHEDHAGALALLERVNALKPDHPRVQHLMGRASFGRGDLHEALRAFRRAAELREEPHSHLWAGQCLERMQDWRGAEDHLRRALAVGGDRGALELELYLALGRVTLEAGRPDKAIKELRKALRLAPDHVSASVTLARALLERDQAHEAWAQLERVQQQLAGPTAWLIQAQVAHATGRGQQALAACALLLEDADARPEQREHALLLTATLAAQDQDQSSRQRALDALDDLERLRPGESSARALTLRAKLVLDAADAADASALGRAHALLARALGRDPASPEARLLAGQLELTRQDLTRAEAHYQRALDAADPAQRAQATLGLAQARLARGELGGARQLAQEALRHQDHGPLLAQALLLLARVELDQGDAARALLALRQASASVDAPLDQLDALTTRAIAQLRPDWSGLPASIDDVMSMSALLTSLRDYLARDHRLVDFLPALQRQLTALDSPLSIAIVGEFNAGKSTLINALIGEDLVPMGVLPTTAHTGIIQYGPRQVARVHFNQGHAQEVTFQQAKALMRSNAEEIAYLEYFYPHPQLRAVHFWDTPGFNALEERHERVAARALEQAEAILWVMDANQVLSQTEFERIESVPQGAERLLVVINKIDRLGPKGRREAALAELIEYVQDYAGDHIAGCFPVSALDAMRALAARQASEPDDQPRQAPPADPADESGMAEFRRHLDERIIERAGHIKTREAKRHIGRLILTLAAFQHGLVQRYQQHARRGEQARAALTRSARSHSEQRAQQELMTLEERLDGMLRAVVKEVQESLRPSGSLLNPRMTMSEEDRRFIQDQLLEGFVGLLAQSLERVSQDIVSLETELMRELEPMMSAMSLQDTRALNQRQEGFREEVNALRLLLRERVYGRLDARASGQLQAGGAQAMLAIEATQDATRWRASLRQLLPELRPSFRDDLSAWYQGYFDAASRFLLRVQHDMEVLELEARHRYDLGPLEALVLGAPLALDEDPPHEDERAPDDHAPDDHAPALKDPP